MANTMIQNDSSVARDMRRNSASVAPETVSKSSMILNHLGTMVIVMPSIDSVLPAMRSAAKVMAVKLRST